METPKHQCQCPEDPCVDCERVFVNFEATRRAGCYKKHSGSTSVCDKCKRSFCEDCMAWYPDGDDWVCEDCVVWQPDGDDQIV